MSFIDPLDIWGGLGGAHQPYTLTWRQVRAYRFRFSIWRFSETRTNGKPGPLAWGRIRIDVPALFETGESAKVPDGFLLVEADNFETLDKIHTVYAVDLQPGDVIEQTEGDEAGQFWIIRGDPKYRNWRANKQMLRAARLPALPDGVTAS